MNVKNFLLAGLAGGITDFLLGWLFYGILFHDYFGGSEPNLTYIFAGCMSFGFLLSYVYVRWANITTLMAGARAGAGIGAIMGLMENFFRVAMDNGALDQQFGVDVVICLVIGAGVGAVVAAVNGGLSKSAT
ncbi:hypothetical protein [Flavobacterium sp.]|uniref:hypothetical protein n=1 Tax=Flavobacterium sp. TaxID=239 RepID=UPI00286BE810|nr:hypothetical protein [Flavobacterium sp.]